MTTLARMILNSGREIELHELTQRRTYAGVLEGVATTQRNKRLLNDLRIAWERKAGATPVLMLPVQETPRGFGSRRSAMLPLLTCVGRFRSDALKEPDGLVFSELIVIWLQDDFAMPVEPAALEQIRRIEWEKAATDFRS